MSRTWLLQNAEDVAGVRPVPAGQLGNPSQDSVGQPFDEALGEFVGELIHHGFGQPLAVTRSPDACPGSCCPLPRSELGYDLRWDAVALHGHTSEIQRNIAEAPCSWRDPSALPLPAISPTSPKSANAVGVRAARSMGERVACFKA
jgi:hypothetical protein